MAIESLSTRPWILLPGTLCTGEVFTGCLDLLGVPEASRHTVLLTHGDIADYQEPLAALCTAQSIMCGFSLGAIVAAHLADQLAPAAFVLFGLNPLADDPTKREGRLRLASDTHERGGAAAMAERCGPLAGDAPEEVHRRILDMAAQMQGHIDAQTRLALSRPGATASLSAALSPVSLFVGGDDVMTPPELSRDMASIGKYCQTCVLPGLGHYALLEDPRACADALVSRIRIGSGIST